MLDGETLLLSHGGKDGRNATIERHGEELECGGALVCPARSDWKIDSYATASLVIYVREVGFLLD